ncbi:MAG: MATE family efflux transporter [Clostridia bacterium]|nr:MATE family efflux transporter [Clostridia bacterium]
MVKTREIDMTKGPILKNLLICAIPLIIMNILQLLFNAADIAIVGIFRGDDAVAAVGANTSLIGLITGLFIGLSTGANVILAKYRGKNNQDGAKKVVGTSICISLIAGFILVIVGIFFANYFLRWMGCPEEILPEATKYLTIYLTGMPVVMLYNFLASILRAVGDTLRPMVFLLISGVINVGLNVFFIKVFNMSVDGVAYATVISQVFSAFCCLFVVLKSKGYSKFSFKHFRIYKKELIEIMKVGIPGGIQSCLFSLSNVFLQSAVNALGTDTIAANAASAQFDAIVYFVGNSIATACMSFISQNYGSGDISRVKKVIKISLIVVVIGALGVGTVVVLFSKYLLKIMTNSAHVISIAQVRLRIIGFTYFLCGIMEVFSLSMRALGKATTSMIICLIGVCIFRIIWINTIYHINETYAMIYLSYPITWVMTIVTLAIFLVKLIKKIEWQNRKKIEK